MTTIDATGMHFQALCRRVKESGDGVVIRNCLGQRYLAAGMGGADITIHGTPGNALGAYFDGGTITVHGNAQDATGDTMNDGTICIHGSSGDATGYAMRGGRILVRDEARYRTGIHMKAYRDKVPVLVIGRRAGNFLGEYQAGGRIVVLGIGQEGKPPVGDFCGTGMHGGAIYLRCETPPDSLPAQVSVGEADEGDLAEIAGDVAAFCEAFGGDAAALLRERIWVLRPNAANPYRQMYTHI